MSSHVDTSKKNRHTSEAEKRRIGEIVRPILRWGFNCSTTELITHALCEIDDFSELANQDFMPRWQNADISPEMLANPDFTEGICTLMSDAQAVWLSKWLLTYAHRRIEVATHRQLLHLCQLKHRILEEYDGYHRLRHHIRFTDYQKDDQTLCLAEAIWRRDRLGDEWVTKLNEWVAMGHRRGAVNISVAEIVTDAFRHARRLPGSKRPCETLPPRDAGNSSLCAWGRGELDHVVRWCEDSSAGDDDSCYVQPKALTAFNYTYVEISRILDANPWIRRKPAPMKDGRPHPNRKIIHFPDFSRYAKNVPPGQVARIDRPAADLAAAARQIDGEPSIRHFHATISS